MNMELQISKGGHFSGIKKNTGTNEMAVKSLNKMFGQNYEDYTIVELNISQEVTEHDSLFQSIKKKLYKIFRMESVTLKLVNLIKSDTIQYYMCED